MNDPSNDPRMTAYVFGELTAEELKQFEAELADSPELKTAVDELRQTVAWAETQLKTSDDPLLNSEQAQRVQRAAQRAGELVETARSPSSSASWSSGAKLALAASLLIAATVSVYALTQLAPSRDLALNSPASEMSSRDHQDDPQRGLAPGSEKEGLHFVEGKSLNGRDVDGTEEFELKSEMTVNEVKPGGRQIDVPDGGTVLLGGIRRRMESRVASNGGFRFSPQPELTRFEGDPDDGLGPGVRGDQFDLIIENDFVRVSNQPLSTFSIDVDTASYAKVRNYLQQMNRLPRADAVRLEELINYFTYDYAPPTDEHPFAAHLGVASCPWDASHRLVRVALKGQEVQFEQRPASNLVFLLDVSGSMNNPDKLPLVKKGMRMLVDQLGENDRLAIVVYAGAAGLVMESTTCDQKEQILQSLEMLQAGGSTNGGAGIQLAYQQAMDHFISGGVNRVILCTDGDFNVGTTSNDELVRMVEENAKANVDLTVLGFGMGNHNDGMLEQITNKGNGNYAFIDTEQEAKKVLVEQINGTLVTIAKDVKIQVEFNPAQVYAYRLLGYENRLMAAQDFNDDTKDAGEIGAGHTVTALYELVPVGAAETVSIPEVDPLKYQATPETSGPSEAGELLTLKLRYKQPGEDTSTKLEFPLVDADQNFSEMDRDFRFAAAVAGWGMLLRDSKYKGTLGYDAVLEIATEAAQDDRSGYREEFLELVRISQRLAE